MDMNNNLLSGTSNIVASLVSGNDTSNEDPEL